MSHCQTHGLEFGSYIVWRMAWQHHATSLSSTNEGTPISGWFVMENLSRNGWFGGTPYFEKPTLFLDMFGTFFFVDYWSQGRFTAAQVAGLVDEERVSRSSTQWIWKMKLLHRQTICIHHNVYQCSHHHVYMISHIPLKNERTSK